MQIKLKTITIAGSFLNSLKHLVVVILVFTAGVSNVFGWGMGHSAATQSALDVQPDWVKDLFAGERNNLVAIYAHYPDTPVSNTNSRPYIYFHKGVPFHYFPEEPMEMNFDRCLGGFTFAFENAVKAIHEKRITDAAKFLGALAHTLEDSGGPQHGLEGVMGLRREWATGYPMLDQLFPPPPEKLNDPICIVLGGYVPGTQTNASIRDYSPKLLGTTAKEAAFCMYRRFWDLLISSRSGAVKITRAYYAGDKNGVVTRLDEELKFGAQVVADMFYTAACIGTGRFDAGEIAATEVTRVEDLVPLVRPWYLAPGALAYSYDCIKKHAVYDDKFNRFPLSVLMERDGKIEKVVFEKGFSTAQNSRIMWKIPGGIYDRLEVVPGFSADIPGNGKINIKISLDKKVVFETGPITGKEPVKPALLEIFHGGSLEFYAEVVGKECPSACIVYGNPVLVRAHKPGMSFKPNTVE